MRGVQVLIRYLGHRPLDMISSADIEHIKIARSRERRKHARAREVLGRRLLEMKSEWLFPAATDSSRPVASVADAHEAAIRRSKIERPFRLYDLRHTALTRMAMAGVDLPILRELAGHASIQMTMRYVHPTTEHKKLALLRFEESTRKADLSNNAIAWPVEAQVGQPSSNHPPRR
jgi:integrase